MPRFEVTFKGDRYDVTVRGDSAEDVVKEYLSVASELERTLKSRRPPRRSSGQPSDGGDRSSTSEEATAYETLADLSIPAKTIDRLVEERSKLTNWQVLFVLLHYAPKGLANKQIRTFSEELGKPISYSWLDSEFHRRTNEGRVISRRVPGSKETLYFLAVPGKKEAQELVQSLDRRSDDQKHE